MANFNLLIQSILSCRIRGSIAKYEDQHILQFKCEFMFDIRYMDHGNNIHKPYKYRGLVKYFRFLDNY